MPTVPWFDPGQAGLIGGVVGASVGLWGAAVGTAAGILVPRGRGKGLVLGLLGLGLFVGTGAVAAGITAAARGQPFVVWYLFLQLGALLTLLSGIFLVVVRGRYRQAELRRMTADELS